MNEVMIGILGLAAVLVLFLTGIEIGFGMAIIGFAGFAYIVSVGAAANLMARDFFDVLGSYSFTVVPLFILMGQIAFNAGIAKRLYDTAYKFTGHIPGGLAMATVGAEGAFGTITGSAIATAATFAGVAIPEMDRYHYSKKLSSGVVTVGATLGSLIPPSVPLIVYGMITEQSIGRLFLAAIIPGLMILAIFISIIYVTCKINPSLGPKGEKSTWKQRKSSLTDVVWVLAIFIIMIGGMTKGFFTPTEGGSIGTFAVFLLSVCKRDIGFKGLVKSIVDSMNTACMIMILITGSIIFGHFLVVTKIPLIAADWLVQLPFHPHIVMILILLIYELGGSFIDDLAFMVLATPVFFPAVLKLGYDPIWFGIILHIFVMIGMVIPPVAINAFTVRKITNLPLRLIYSGVYPFLISLIGCAAILFIFPDIILFLPSLLMSP
jgi:C4-dicarboxylate transporter DctM subunit